MAMGVTRQGPFMPCLRLPARHALHFASTPTVHLQSARNWSSSTHRHLLMATETVIALNSHLLIAEEAQVALNSCPVMSGEAKIAQNGHPLMAREAKTAPNGHPLMTREAKIASNRHTLMAGEAKEASNRHPLIAGEAKEASNRHHLMAGGTKIASNGCLLVAGDAKNTEYRQPLVAGDTKFAANRRPLMGCKEAKSKSSDNKVVAINVVRQGNLQQIRPISASRRGQLAYEREIAANFPREKESRSEQNTWILQARGRVSSLPEKSYPSHSISFTQETISQSPTRESTSRSSWKNAIDEVRLFKQNAASTCVTEISHTSLLSETQEVSAVSKIGHNGDQKTCSEEDSAQKQDLQCPGDGKTGFHCSSGCQVESKGKVGHYLESSSTRSVDNVTSTDGIYNDLFVEGKCEELLSELIKDTVVTNRNFDRPIDCEVSASNQAATGVTDCKGDNVKDKLDRLYKQIFIVDNVETAKMVVGKLMGEYRNLAHACDTEVADIDVKKESPVGHGKVICFSIYCGSEASFGDGKSCVWVDVLDGGEEVLSVFAPYFEDSSIRKVFHNYSFDRHIIGNHGINVRGFYADTMHLARLWNSARREEGGYSLEALTMDPKVMNGAGVAGKDELIEGKVSMKTIFGKRNIKKDGSEGKTIAVAPVEELQKTQRLPWICYSALDSISTWRLWKSLRKKLKDTVWVFQGDSKRTMYDFYEEYWRPFGELLVQMECRGMLVDREYLSKMEEVAIIEQEKSASQFKNWASTYCPDAKYMNVGSDTQVRQLLFGGIPNKKDPSVFMPNVRTMKVPNVDNFIEEGKKMPGKFRNIVLCGLGVTMEVEKYTMSGWPTVSSEALKALAGKVSVDYSNLEDESENECATDLDEGSVVLTSSGVNIVGNICENKVEADPSVYGTAYGAFGGGKKGKEACHAIAALCEVSSINTLISNFLQPLQGKEISGMDGRVHCSLNINTETGRLSARKPNLQNQPALEKDRYKIRQAFIANPGNSLIVADYGQLELRILAHLSNCKSMLDAFKAGGDFHSRTAMNMYPHVRDAVEKNNVLLEWDPQPGEEKPPIPLLKDVFATERRKAKMLNFSIAYGKTPVGLSKDWKVTLKEAKETVNLWYNERKEVLQWQEERKHEAQTKQCVYTLLGRARHLPCLKSASFGQKGHIERAAINTPVQGSAADVAMCAMLEIARNARLKELGWTLVLQVHDEVILEGPVETVEEAKSLVVNCMSYPFYGKNILRVDLAVDAKYASNWYAAK